MAKIQRQEAWSTRIPPTSGPRIKEIPVQAVQLPTALPWAGPVKFDIIIASELGTRKAPATPCNALAPTRKPLFGATAHNSDAMPKPSRPRLKILLRPNRSDNEPAIRIKEPNVSK